MKQVKNWRAIGLLVCSLFSTLMIASCQEKGLEIKWDKWNVPHIIAESEADAFYALGWAQMEAHGNLVLKLYGQARGEAASYWGAEFLDSDKQKHLLQIPQRAEEWLDAQAEPLQSNMRQFVAGMNAYAEKHGDQLSDDMKLVLPVRDSDPFAHLQVAYHLGVAGFGLQPQAEQWKNAGSNAWAIAPSKSESGNSLLLMQPHPPWMDNYLFFESHVITPNNNRYGISSIGSPVMAMGFNSNLGWALTFNQADASDLYDLQAGENGYLFDGNWEAFEEHDITIRVKNGDAFSEEKITAKKSRFGWVVEEKDGKALALRLGGLEKPYFTQQFYDMSQAKNQKEFEAALSTLQLPLQNVIYADKAGDIFYLYNGEIPKRANPNYGYWQQVQDGSKRENLVTEYLSYEELPKFSNPPSGFISNTNNPPWSSTYPGVLNPNDYPSTIAPNFLDYRTQRALRMLHEEEKVSFEELGKMIFSTHSELADRTLPALIEYGGSQSDQDLKDAAEILKNWDRTFRPDSKGAVLFTTWTLSFRGQMFEDGFDLSDPLAKPTQLSEAAKSHLNAAVQSTKQRYGSLDIAWGEVEKLQFKGNVRPSSIGLNETGSFAAGFYVRMSEKEYMMMGGPSFSAIIEFGEEVKARGLLSYGNSTQKPSATQLQLLSDQNLRSIYFSKEDVIAAETRSEPLDK